MKHILLKLSFLCASTFFMNVAGAVSLFVEKWGNNNAECSRTEPCNEIAAALAIATTNDRIIVGPGTYSGGLQILQDGIRLESTGGPRVTIIDGRSSPGITAIDVQADRVSIGRTGGRGFTIQSFNADAINAGSGDEVIGCEPDPQLVDGELVAVPILSGPNLVSRLRIEGNNIVHLSNDVPSTENIRCELVLGASSVFTPELVQGPVLSNAIDVFGDGIILTGNNILGQGLIVVNLFSTFTRSTIRDNNIKHSFINLNNLAGFPTFGGEPFYNSLGIFGDSSNISNNQFESLGLDISRLVDVNGVEFVSPRGVTLFSQRASTFSNNIVRGFSIGISTSSPQRVSRNIVIDPSNIGIIEQGGSDILDNTVTSTQPFSITGIAALNSRLIRGNNVSGFNRGTALLLFQDDTGNFLNRSFTSVSNNNLYDSGGPSRCSVFIAHEENPFGQPIAILPVRMSRNFFGSASEQPLIIESSNNDTDGLPSAPTNSETWNICAQDGLVNLVSGEPEIEEVTTNPTLRANRVRALLRNNPF